MDLDLAEYSLDALRLSVGGMRLELSRGPYVPGGPDQLTASIMIERDFSLVSARGPATIKIDDWAELSQLRPLLGQEVVSARVSDDGHLIVEFPRHELHVAPLERYEAWNVAWFDGRLVASTPGGDLASWFARNTSP
ncbi:MAG: DUF6188 family protein [Dehalococcoidia bacterium]